MRIRKVLTLVASVAVLSAGLVSNPIQANAAVDVYTTPGKHNVNGRQWSTTCEKYSKTVDRCRTNIIATQVVESRGKFVSKKGWVFNNLTYRKSDRGQWRNNPLGNTGSWTDNSGRRWKTECDNASTGGNGCRSYIYSNVIEKNSRGAFAKRSKWVFNNIVHFNPGSSASSGGSSNTSRMSMPLRSYRFSSQFGPRIHPITKKQSFHTGLDMAASCGSSITAARGGVVQSSGWNNAYGNRVVIQSSNNILTTYSHMKAIRVKKGQYVSEGSAVGTVGTTGLSTGCHLHFEVVRNNYYVNPWSYLTGKSNPTNATKRYANPSIRSLSAVETQNQAKGIYPVATAADIAEADAHHLHGEDDIHDESETILTNEEYFDIETDLPVDGNEEESNE